MKHGWLWDLVVSVILSILLVGCATQGNYIREIPDSLRSSAQVSSARSSQDPLIVAIRWPALIDATAEQAVLANWLVYFRETFGHEPSADDYATGVLNAANSYYAAELYVAFQRLLPHAHVILDPQVVTKGKAGNVTLMPLVESNVPASLVVDFANFDSSRYPFLGTQFSYILRTPPMLSPGNCGLLLAMEHQRFGPEEGDRSDGECRTSASVSGSPALWYLGASDRRDRSKSVKAASRFPLRSDLTVLYPEVRETTAGLFGATPTEYMATSRPSKVEDVPNMPVHPHLVNFAAIAASAPPVSAASVDFDQLLVPYVQNLDATLANAIAEKRAATPAQRANLTLIKKLLSAELKARGRRDQLTVGWILSGDFGKSFRNARDKSYKGFTSVMGASWASAALLVAATPVPSGADPNAYLGYQSKMLSAHMSNVNDASKSFYLSYVPAVESMEQESIQFEGRRIPVDISDQKALSQAMRGLYARYKTQ